MDITFKMFHRYLILLVLAIFSASIEAQTPAGSHAKIFIGDNENDTTSIYSFNENYQNFEIPVYVLVVNSTTGQELPEPPGCNPACISVTCETTLPQFGYSDATFRPKDVVDGYAIVEFDTPVPGRPVDLRCYVEADKDLSLSDPVTFEIRPAGTVSIFEPVVQVVETPEADRKFTVELSENVESFNVTVMCEQVPTIIQTVESVVENSSVSQAECSSCRPCDPGSSQNAEIIVENLVNQELSREGQTNLTFVDATLMTGERKAKVAYVVVDRGTPVMVQCTAQSEPPSTDAQFQEMTSMGSGAEFVMLQNTARMLPETAQISTTQMEVYLSLDYIPTSPVQFACYLKMAEDSIHAQELIANPTCVMPDLTTVQPPVTGTIDVTDILATDEAFTTIILDENTTEAVAPTSTATPPTVPVSGNWTLDKQELTIPNEPATDVCQDNYCQLSITRGLPDVTMATSELFVVTCCAPSNINDPEYQNLNAALVVSSYLTPTRPINETAATAAEFLEEGSTILDPAFVEVSPCPCDLLENACDINCCCDRGPETDEGYCNEDDISKTFDCIPGIPGGNTSAAPDYMCNSGYPLRSDWFPVMCVQWNNSAYLGQFIYEESALRDTSTYNSKANAHRVQTTEETSDKFPSEVDPKGGYVDGSSVRTALSSQAASNSYYYGENYRLSLPRRTLSGTCVPTSPVRFLRPYTDSCTWAMSESLCSQFSPLSAYTYVQSDQWTGPKGPLVLANPYNKVLAATTVHYLCADSAAGYVRTSGSYRDVLRSGQSQLFDYVLPAEEDCEFDFTSGAYICVNQTSSGGDRVVMAPTRCEFDDGYTAPPIPEYDITTDTCNNVVLSVSYAFVWSNQDIVTLNAIVILGNVSMTTDLSMTAMDTNSTILTQKFETEFSHQLSADKTSVETDGTVPYARSGNPGYDRGLPVISGLEMNTTDNFTYLDTNSSSRLSLWMPGASNLCNDANRHDVRFRVAEQGSCILLLSFDDLQSCDYLRRLVLNRQDSLMLSNKISLGGDPNYTDITTGWANILRQDISGIILINDTMTTESPLTTMADGLTNETLSDFLDHVQGRCTNVPSGIHVDIMYAVVGQRDAVPIHQIMGSRVSYTLSTWQLGCVGPGGVACSGNETWSNYTTQPFQLFSSVRYIEVPAVEPAPKTLFEETTESRVSKCEGDACWQEMFYPFLRINPGDSLQYTTSLGLLSLLFLLGLFLVSRPVSRWDYLHAEL